MPGPAGSGFGRFAFPQVEGAATFGAYSVCLALHFGNNAHISRFDASILSPIAAMSSLAPSRSSFSRRAAPAPVVPTSKYLTFELAAEHYGIDILCVQEIRSYEVPTRLAHAPEFVRGVIHLRGVIVPVVDLRVKLGCERADINEFTVVIILQVDGVVLGAVVDAVADVVALQDDAIKPAPQFQGAVDTSFVRGMAAQGEQMLIIVDIAKLLSPEEMGLLSRAQGSAAVES